MSTKQKSLNPLKIETGLASWKKVRGIKPRLQKAVAATFALVPAGLRTLEKKSAFTVLLTSDAVVKRLNNDWRGFNRPTNVLSFPQFSGRDLLKQRRARGEVYLGDIAIAYQYTGVEAREEQKVFLDHLTHLTIHGLLHLLGYDHGTSAEAGRMERLEKKIMASLGLPDPYAPPALPKTKRKKK